MGISRERLDKMSDTDIKGRIDEIDLYLGGDGCYSPKLTESEYEDLTDERAELVTELQIRDWELSQMSDNEDFSSSKSNKRDNIERE